MDLDGVYGDLANFASAPAWPGYPGEVNPGGREMIRDAAHPCHGCPLESEHRVQGRADFPEHVEAGAAPPFGAEYLWPSSRLVHKMASVNEQLMLLANGLNASASNIGSQDAPGNAFSALILTARIIGSSGNVLTLKSELNPLNFRVPLYVLNPNYEPGNEEEPRYLDLGLQTQLQTCDFAFLIGSIHSAKIGPQLVKVLSDSWGGPNATWRAEFNQSVEGAEQVINELVYSEATVEFYRSVLQPPTWPDEIARQSYPLYVARREGVKVTWADLQASDLKPRLELLDTAGESCRVAIPRAPQGSFLGSFRCLKKDGASGVVTDATAAAIASLTVEHIGTSGYRSTIDAGALILADGDELKLTFEPEWRASDGAAVKRASCQSICHHSKYHEHMGWACGLGGARALDEDGDPADVPPSGLANYREGGEHGCYQVGVCDRFLESAPWSYPLHLGAFLLAAHNGSAYVEKQRNAGSQDPNNFYTTRPPWPSGVPGVKTLGGRRQTTPGSFRPIRRPFPQPGGYVWVEGSGNDREIHTGAEYDLADAGQIDLAAGEYPKPGKIFSLRARNDARDGLGRLWTDEADPTRAARDAGPIVPGCSLANEGQIPDRSRNEGQSITATRRLVHLPRIDLRAALRGVVQERDHAAAILNADDSLTVYIKPLMRDHHTGFYIPKASGIIAAASMDGGRVRLEIANSQWAGTFIPEPDDPMSEAPCYFNGGGRFVALPPAASGLDYQDDEWGIEGGAPYRLAMPGDACRINGAAGSDATTIALTAYHIDKALPCAGASEPWDGSNPGPPATWLFPPRNYDDWLHKRDVVWLYDLPNGILADNLANLVGANIAAYAYGIIAPNKVDDISIKLGPYQSDWQPLAGSAFAVVDCFSGRIDIDAAVIEALDRTQGHCIEVDATLLDMRAPVRSSLLREVIRCQEALDTINLGGIAGPDGRRYVANQVESPFAEQWGVSMPTICANQSAPPEAGLGLLLNTPCNPDVQELCDPGYHVAGEVDLFAGAQTGGANINRLSFSVGFLGGAGGTTQFVSVHDLSLNSVFTLPILGPLATWPGGPDTIVSAKCSARFGALSHRRVRYDFYPDGVGGIATDETVEIDVTGSATFRLGLYGLKINTATGRTWLVPIGTGGVKSSTAGNWVDFDLTNAIKQAVSLKASDFIAFYIIPAPEAADVPVGSDAAESLAASMPRPHFDVYEPWLSGCDGFGVPLENPDKSNREGFFRQETYGWDSMEVKNLVVTFQSLDDWALPIVRNGDQLHNWPPKVGA